MARRRGRDTGWAARAAPAVLTGLGGVLLAVGCHSSEPQRTSPPSLAPPRGGSGRLTRAQALEEARVGADAPEEAIRRLDLRGFDFELSEEVLAWFEEEGIEAEVLDYLRKRARVDWESLRGDVDPERPR